MGKHEKTWEFEDVGVVVAAAGSATRFGGGRNKLLCELNGLPVVCHCLKTFLHGGVLAENVVVVVPEIQNPDFRTVLDAHSLGGVQLVNGGLARQDSVWAGINALPASVEIVAIHDAARPFTKIELLVDCVESARERGSGVAAHKVTDTVKIAKVDGQVMSTPDREILWAAETPQVFRRSLIESAYGRLALSGDRLTDDAQAVERMGGDVFLVPHESVNRKITFARDLRR